MGATEAAQQATPDVRSTDQAALGWSRLSTSDRAVLAGALVFGIGLRVWVMHSPLRVLDSDEAVVGLMARHLLYQHHSVTFYWGQAYGGSLEASLVAGAFALFGATTGALKAVSLVLSGVAVALIWLLARRAVGERIGAYAAAAFWVGSPYYVWWSTKERGFYWVCLDLGLLTLLLAWLIAHPPAPPRARGWWVLLGLVAGGNFWTSPQSLYFTIPALLYLAVRARPKAWDALAALVGALVGALPWVTFNLHYGFASLSPPGVKYSYFKRLSVLARTGLPVVTGLENTKGWLVAYLFPALYAAALLAVVALIFGRRRSPGLLVTIAIVVFPFLYAVVGDSSPITQGRYLLFLAPLVWIVTMRALARPLAMGAALAVLAVLSVFALGQLEHVEVEMAAGSPVPVSDAPLVAYLRAHPGVTFVGNYWLVYRTVFEAKEGNLGSPEPVRASRYPTYDRLVRDGPRPPIHVFLSGEADEPGFRAQAATRPGCYDRLELGRFVVYPLRAGLSAAEQARCRL